jgi:hypothetical protein
MLPGHYFLSADKSNSEIGQNAYIPVLLKIIIRFDRSE